MSIANWVKLLIPVLLFASFPVERFIAWVITHITKGATK